MPKEHPDIYHPLRDRKSSYVFIHAVSPGREQNVRAVSFLNVLFTEVVEQFDEKLTDRNKRNLLLPSLEGRNITVHTKIRPAHDKETGLIQGQRMLKGQLPLGIDVMSPVGEYGDTLSQAYIKSAISLSSLFQELVETEDLDITHAEALRTETFGKRIRRSIYEALQTTVGTVSLLTSERVRYYENDPIALLRQIHAKEILNQISLQAPFGVIIPMVRHCELFSHPLLPVDNNDGTMGVELNPSVITHLKEAKKQKIPETAPGFRGMGCPVGRANMSGYHLDGTVDTNRETAIQLLFSHFIDYTDYYYKASQRLTIPRIRQGKRKTESAPWRLL